MYTLTVFTCGKDHTHVVCVCECTHSTPLPTPLHSTHSPLGECQLPTVTGGVVEWREWSGLSTVGGKEGEYTVPLGTVVLTIG